MDARPYVVCEGCRLSVEDITQFRKYYKHYCLREAIPPYRSQRICKCPEVRHELTSNGPLPLFPIDKRHKHVGTTATKVQTSKTCGLLQVNDLVKNHKDDTKQSQYNSLQSKSFPPDKPNESTSAANDGFKGFLTETEDHLVKFVASKLSSHYPFGCVHLSVMFGPLIFENGVAG